MCTMLLGFAILAILYTSKITWSIPFIILGIGFLTGEAYIYPGKITLIVLVSLIPYIRKEIKKDIKKVITA